MIPVLGPASPDSVSGNHPAVLVCAAGGLRILDAGPPPHPAGGTASAWCEALVQVPGMTHPVWFISVHLPARSATSQRIQASRSVRVPVMQLAAAVVMTAAGAGVALVASSSAVARVAAGVCALVVAARVAGPPVARWRRHRAGEPEWVAAAAVHERSWPGRVPAATLAAVARYLPVLAAARGLDRGWLYVGRCPDTGEHTWVCEAAGVWEPGGRLMAVLGEHSAAVPAVAAVSLAHEVGHVRGWTRRLLAVVGGGWRAGGWGWAAAGLAGAAFWGWPGVLTAAVVFHVASVLALWAGEAGCDVGAARAEGREATLTAFGFIACRQAARRAATGRWQAAAGALRWVALPTHPPVSLRAAIIRATTRP